MNLKIVDGGARLLTSPARKCAGPTNVVLRNETILFNARPHPGLLHQEKEKRSLRLAVKPASGLVLRQSNLRKLETLFPLLGGEGQGEGGQQTLLSFTPQPAVPEAGAPGSGAKGQR